MLSSAFALLLSPLVLAAPIAEYSLYQRDSVSLPASQSPNFSGDVTACQGYTLGNVTATSTGGLTAPLNLISSCAAYGNDISSLALSVEYETPERLHVHIYDTALHQYQLDDSILPRPARTTYDANSANESDLEFSYVSNPFAFWVMRKSDGVILFDTRPQNIPTYNDTVEIEGSASNYTLLPAHPLVFEDQYLQISSAIPTDTNFYGLGEVIAGSGYRRNTSGSVQTFWARDVGDPVDENMYGTHPFYMETRYNQSLGKSASHGVFLLNSNGMDVVLRDGAIQYRAIGGTLDFYFVSGPSPVDVASQYAQTVGLPQAMPFWSFGFHLCRWGYTSINETRDQVVAMRAAGIPLENMWNDIDWMRHYREFQYDQNFDPADYTAFVSELHANNQHYIPIIDAAIGILYNDTDSFDVYERGAELGVWMRNPDGTFYVGSVWPGYTVFPDWFHPQMQTVWNEAFQNLSKVVDFDGIWLDMNEPSSFIDGSVTNSSIPLNQTAVAFAASSSLNTPTAPPADLPEGYWNYTSGTSGNITVDGKLTYGENGTAPINTACRRAMHQLDLSRALVSRHDGSAKRDMPRDTHDLEKRVLFECGPLPLSKRQTGGYVPQVPLVDAPPYPIRNGGGRLSHNTVSPNATHYGGLQEYSVHNVWGTMEEIATNNMLQTLKPGLRPFIVGRSTFAGVGRKTAHWLGDNYSTFAYMKRAIQGVLQFNLFAVPMVGPDTCGFNGNTDEDLCNRWMQLSAFFPFYRNHNTKLALSQEPYRWDSVRNASITAINARYALLPYWLSLFAEASQYGKPPVCALFYEFDDPALYGVDAQFLVGPSILVTPVLEPNTSAVAGYFPSANGTTWRDWFTHMPLDLSGANDTSVASPVVTLDAPLGSIGVHIRSGSVLLLHAHPAYTLTETRAGSYALLISLDNSGDAAGTAYIDDGVSLPVVAQTKLDFVVTNGTLNVTPSASMNGSFAINQTLESVTVLGVTSKPSTVTLGGQQISNVTYMNATQEVVVGGLTADLNQALQMSWS